MHMGNKDWTCKSMQGNTYSTFVVDEGSGKHFAYHSADKTAKEKVVRQFVQEEVIPSGSRMVEQLTADCDQNFLDR
jgi:hypothetical protein